MSGGSEPREHPSRHSDCMKRKQMYESAVGCVNNYEPEGVMNVCECMRVNDNAERCANSGGYKGVMDVCERI
eukprot:6937260-Heterocapsa_arctica.AAC.1